ncbi:MAG: hypothetical protein E7184_03395 [Erysipelotrichaceae bacterium]|nr:hypothetical protein [Erysipelotrichaceae bacterium]
MAARNREELLNVIRELKSEKFKVTFADAISGKYKTKFNLLIRGLKTLMEKNILNSKHIDDIMKGIGDVDQYEKKISDEIKIKLFENIDLLPVNILKYRTNARTIADTEIDRISSVIRNKTLKLIDSFYYSKAESIIKECNNSREIIDSLKSLLEIESDFENILNNQKAMLFIVTYQNPVIEFNKKFQNQMNLGHISSEMLDDIDDFLGHGLRIAGDLETRERDLKELQEKIGEFTIKKGDVKK